MPEKCDSVTRTGAYCSVSPTIMVYPFSYILYSSISCIVKVFPTSFVRSFGSYLGRGCLALSKSCTPAIIPPSPNSILPVPLGSTTAATQLGWAYP